jgi:large subunit ribosomal protein L4
VPGKLHVAMPKRMRRLAIRSAISSKVVDGELIVFESLAIDSPKTKAMAAPLKAAGIARTALVVTAAPELNVRLSTRNIVGMSYLPADVLNTYDILRHKQLVLTVDAVRRIEAVWGGERAEKRRAPAPPALTAGGS